MRHILILLALSLCISVFAAGNSNWEYNYSTGKMDMVYDEAKITNTDDTTLQGFLASPATVQTALERIDNINAASFPVITTNFNGILNSTTDTVQECLEALDDINASSTPTTVTNFNTRLGAGDDTVQKALDTLDDSPDDDQPDDDSEVPDNISVSNVGQFIDGGANPIDGDKLEITATWNNITPDTGIAEADSVDDLSAILEGIDDALGAAGGATAWDDISDPDANGDINFGSFTEQIITSDFRIGDGVNNYIKFASLPTITIQFQGTADIDLPNDSVDSGDVNFNYAASASEGGSATSGDSATAFFSAGTIEHEYGGVEANVSGYSGLLGVNGGATSEVDTMAELETHLGGANVIEASELVGANEAYSSGWNADTGIPEKDDIYDYLHNFDSDDDSSFTDETWYTNIFDGTTAFTGFNGVSIFIDGGAAAIDGDKIEITATWDNITPDTSIGEADSVDDLAAILEGIDDALASVGGASTALDNLASVAINTSLISDTANTDDLGSEALYWKKLYLASEVSFEGATDDNKQTTVSVTDPTEDRTITIGDLNVDLSQSTDQYVLYYNANSKTWEGGVASGATATGQFSRDTTAGDGTQQVTGLSFKPTRFLFFGAEDDAGEASWGTDDGSNAQCVYRKLANYNGDTTYSIYDYEGGGTVNRAKITATDHGSFTVTWSKAGSPSGTYKVTYIAFEK